MTLFQLLLLQRWLPLPATQTEKQSRIQKATEFHMHQTMQAARSNLPRRCTNEQLGQKRNFGMCALVDSCVPPSALEVFGHDQLTPAMNGRITR